MYLFYFPFIYLFTELDDKELIPRVTQDGKVLGHYVNVDGVLFRANLIRNGKVPDHRTNLPKLREMTTFDDDVLICAYVKAGNLNKINESIIGIQSECWMWNIYIFLNNYYRD